MTSSSPDDGFRDAYNRLIADVTQRYGIPLHVCDVKDPFTGDLDGAEIHVDYAEDIESALFIVVHLFGHTVQWNISAEYRALGADLSIGKGEDVLMKILRYEENATRYSLQLMHDVGIKDLDQWVSDYFAADWKYLAHYYRTGEKLDFRKLIEPGKGALLTPLRIPDFKPQKWISRWSF